MSIHPVFLLLPILILVVALAYIFFRFWMLQREIAAYPKIHYKNRLLGMGAIINSDIESEIAHEHGSEAALRAISALLSEYSKAQNNGVHHD